MNFAVPSRRVVIGILLTGAALITGGLCWRRPGAEDSAGPQPRRSAALFLPGRMATRFDTREAEPARYRANLLLRIIPPAGTAGNANEWRPADVISTPVLNAVILDRKLTGQWSLNPDDALTKLERMVAAVPSGDSPLMTTLQVSAPGGSEASDLAGALVTAFKDRLDSMVSERCEHMTRAMDERIKEQMEAVRQTRNQMLECMNSRQVVDYEFLDALNGQAGVIQPELDASLNPEIKLAWFTHQLESLKTLPAENLADFLAAAILPFDHPVTKLCQDWQAVAPSAAALAGADSGREGGTVGTFKRSVELKQEEAAAAVSDYKNKLERWITQATQALPAGDDGAVANPNTEVIRQSDYRKLKQRYNADSNLLKVLKEQAARLHADDAPFYIPPVVVLKTTLERLPP